MAELRRLWYLPNTNDIRTRPRYVRSVASIWVDTLNRELDIEEWKLNPDIFSIIQQRWEPHFIDRFASMVNTQIPVSTHDGATPIARTSTAYTYPTQHGGARTASATRHGPRSQRWPTSYANRAQQLPSWLPIGPTNRGTKPSTTP
jgi:hypothetical protein